MKSAAELVTETTADLARLDTLRDGASAAAVEAKTLMTDGDYSSRAAGRLRAAHELVQRLEREAQDRQALVSRAKNLEIQFNELAADIEKQRKTREERVLFCRDLAKD